MKKLFFIFCLLSVSIFAQADYVSADNKVYDFLERMENIGVINDYNSFEIPKTRMQIAEYLKEVIKNQIVLDKVDKETLEDFKIEYEYELFGTLENSQKIISGNGYNVFSQKQKYLYFLNKPGKANLFINLVGEGQIIFYNDNENNINKSAMLGIAGGEIRGTFLNKFGFSIFGTNGTFVGNRTAVLQRKDLKYNYKINETDTTKFFDKSYGYLTADWKLIRFKIGRDRMKIGYGNIKSILGDDAPLFDYLSLNINYDFFNFSYFHGKLLGRESYVVTPNSGVENVVAEKYIGYHRIGFNISRDVNFGIGEVIIYGDRPIDLSYLNPFNFYKSTEHANRDRDNSMLFVDYKNNSINNLEFYGTLLIDDITFSKLGTGWYGNETLLNLGLYSENLYNILPLGIRFEMIKIDPYVFTHRFIKNNYTNFGYNLGPDLNPNSLLFNFELSYRITHRLDFSLSYSYTKHGANILNPDGSVIVNVGGDINLGHRTSDSKTVKFLDGDLEYYRNLAFNLTYEPFNEIFLKLNASYYNNSLRNLTKEKKLNTFITLSARL